MLVIISYDTPSDSRRRQIADLLAEFGTRAQESVFECWLDAAATRQMEHRLAAIVHAREDDVRLYPVCDRCLRQVATFGKACLSEEPEFYLV